MNEKKKKQIRFQTFLVDIFGGVNLLYLFCKFFKVCSDIKGSEIISTMFLISLLNYINKKRVAKAIGEHTRKRRGEYWVFIWALSCVFMVIVNSIFPGRYNLPLAELSILVPLIFTLYLNDK